MVFVVHVEIEFRDIDEASGTKDATDLVNEEMVILNLIVFQNHNDKREALY